MADCDEFRTRGTTKWATYDTENPVGVRAALLSQRVVGYLVETSPLDKQLQANPYKGRGASFP